MKSFKIVYDIVFVAGVLEGISSELSIEYPISEIEKIEADFKKDIANRKIFGPTSSKYVILNYRIV